MEALQRAVDVCKDRWAIDAHTSTVSEDRRTSQTRHTALGRIPGATSPIWELLQPLRRIILPMASGKDLGTALSSAGLLVLLSELGAPARFFSQQLGPLSTSRYTDCHRFRLV